jgi:iron complex transport system substrate-binding protein
MRRTTLGLLLAVILIACSPTTTSTTQQATTFPPTTQAPGTTIAAFPVTVTADNGEVDISERPDSIVSLSPAATEMLFEIGAGPQVVAVDDLSTYPAEAPVTDLQGFTPNLEAILEYEPDLVVIAFAPGNLIAGLEAVDVPVIHFDTAPDVDAVYDQIEALGAATGNLEAAETVTAGMEEELQAIVDDVGDAGEGITYFHEIDSTLYTATSSTLFGELYGMFGMVNIADEADDGSGYPQLSSEYVVLADPAMIFLADTAYGESAATVSARPGWETMTAVSEGAIVELDSDIASRWGPRIVDFALSVAEGIEAHG